MSKCGTLLFSSFRLLLHSSNVRQLDRCCLTKAKTTIGTLHIWPSYELQQHRTFASSTNSDDTEATLRKKDDKNKNQSAELKSEKETPKREEITAKNKDYDDIAEESAILRQQATDLARRTLSFIVKKQKERKKKSELSKVYTENKLHIKHMVDRLSPTKGSKNVFRNLNVQKAESAEGTQSSSKKKTIKRKQKKPFKSFSLNVFSGANSKFKSKRQLMLNIFKRAKKAKQNKKK